MDVRWAEDGSVYLASGKAGVYELEVDSEQLDARKVLFPRVGGGSLWFSTRLAASSTHIAAAAPAHSLVWKRLDDSASSPELPFAAVEDMDIREDRIVVLGAQRDGRGVWSPDGAIAWIGPLRSGPLKLEPVYYSMSGPGARTMADCTALGIGGVRFLADGSFLVVPGVEEGIYLYAPSGELLRTWQGESAQLDLGCEVSPEIAVKLSGDGHFRQLSFINKRRTLDEILPLPAGPALVVREVSEGNTSWRLALLGLDGGVASTTLPVRSRSGYSHLRGDVRGDEVVLLLLEYGELDDPPVEPPRLIFLRVSP